MVPRDQFQGKWILVVLTMTWSALKQWPRPLFPTLHSMSWVIFFFFFQRRLKRCNLQTVEKYSTWKNNYLERQQIGQWGGLRFLTSLIKVTFWNLGDGTHIHMRNIETDFHMKRWLNRSCVARFLCTRKETAIYFRSKSECSTGKMQHKRRKQIYDFKKSPSNFFLIQ